MEANQVAMIQQLLSQNRRFRKITQRLSSEVAKRHNVTYTQVLTLEILRHHPNTDLNQLAEQLHLSKSSVSGIVERLITGGLVAKAKQDQDQRKLAIQLTKKGQALDAAIHTEFYAQLAPVLQVPSSELASYFQTQQRIIEKFEEECQ